MAWGLFALCMNPDCQVALRAEINQTHAGNLSMEQISALPYLDAVVREIMRLHPPVAFTERVALGDTIVPLDEGYTGADGNITQAVACVFNICLRDR